MEAVGQVSNPYDESDDDLGITISGLPEDLVDVDTASAGETGSGDDAEDDELEYNLDEWSVLEHEAVTERLLEAGIPHRWDGPKLYVAASDEAAVEVVLDAVEGEADPLDPDRDQVAYDLAEWDDDRLTVLVEELDRASIPFAWDGDELFVHADDEQRLDELLDKVAHPHELAVEDDDGDAGGEFLGELFIAADRLQRDPDDHETTVIMLDLVRAAEAAPPPYGLSDNEWKHLRERMTALAELLRDPLIEENAVLASARDLRNALRSYV